MNSENGYQQSNESTAASSSDTRIAVAPPETTIPCGCSAGLAVFCVACGVIDSTCYMRRLYKPTTGCAILVCRDFCRDYQFMLSQPGELLPVCTICWKTIRGEEFIHYMAMDGRVPVCSNLCLEELFKKTTWAPMYRKGRIIAPCPYGPKTEAPSQTLSGVLPNIITSHESV